MAKIINKNNKYPIRHPRYFSEGKNIQTYIGPMDGDVPHGKYIKDINLFNQEKMNCQRHGKEGKRPLENLG